MSRIAEEMEEILTNNPKEVAKERRVLKLKDITKN